MSKDALLAAIPPESEICRKEVPTEKNTDDGPSDMDVVITPSTESAPMLDDNFSRVVLT